MKTYGYYPGCSIHGSAKGYEESLLPVLEKLDLPIRELDDWNCCGATVYMGVSESTWLPTSARNLAIAERMELDEIMAPCSACYLTLRKTIDYMDNHPEKAAGVKRALAAGGYDYKNHTTIRHPLEIMINDVGVDAIAEKVVRPLKGMKIACYYGCQIVRPYLDRHDPEHPDAMEALVRALGAEPIDYPLSTRCCGGSLTGIHEEVGIRLNQILLQEAHRRGADAIITVCPLCQFNLECYQDKINSKMGTQIAMPVLYFTQLMGVALGIGATGLGLERSLIPIEDLFASV